MVGARWLGLGRWWPLLLALKSGVRRRPVACVSSSATLFKDKATDPTSLFVSVPVKAAKNPDDINVGVELSGRLKKDDILRLLTEFARRPRIKKICEENGLNSRLFHQAFMSFRRFCIESESLPVDVHIVFSDILREAGNVDDVLPYFLQHARKAFPHLECMEELKKISDLRLPANWYPEARAMSRKIVFHAGPTNSGKTHRALERFVSAKSGVYCGPLKLLAVEVHAKTNRMGTPCDLLTGEERRYADPGMRPSNHVACTVEMTSVTTPYEVAIIDEVQMLKDTGRGWAWTRALLGVAAEEIHVCGEAAAVDLVKELCLQIGEDVEVRNYKRLTKLTVEDKPLESLRNVRPGDCVVCFSKNDVYHASREIEKQGQQCAVIYGGLPPGTKLAQAKKFNDPEDPCKILVATDAIGMGLNLSIRRIIFYSLVKPILNEKGEKEMTTISTSQALQIGGRAGRFNTSFSEGFVTAFRGEDLAMLKDILDRPVEEIEACGLHPTAEQIELFAYHLPNATLSNLMDIFVSMCEVDHSRYFVCNVDDFKFLADMIQHIRLPLRARYVFCCAPINRKMPFVCTMFLKFARQYSRNEALTLDWLGGNIGWPFRPPTTIVDLVHLEAVFDVLDLYLWLSYRFPDLFPDAELVRDMQRELDEVIQVGVTNITRLLKVSETGHSHGNNEDVEETFVMKNKSGIHDRGLWPDSRSPVADSSLEVYDRGSPNASEEDDGFGESRNAYAKMVSGRGNRDGEKEEDVPVGKGRVTERLLSKGYVTPEILMELRKEWLEESRKKQDDVPKPKWRR